MWVTKLLISPVKKGFFAQKRPNLAQNWHFWSIWARPCRLIQYPVGGSVGGCDARAVSRKTPIYYIDNNITVEYFGVSVLENVHWLVQTQQDLDMTDCRSCPPTHPPIRL